MAKIFVVEDDDSIRDLIFYALTNAGYEVKSFEDGKHIVSAVKCENPDLILLDIMLPGEDGITILGRLKSDNSTANIPVIMLTAKASEIHKVKGLDLGADDYITKPFSVIEMISRIKAVLRRCGKVDTQIIQIGNVSIDPSSRIVKVDGEEINITYKEYELLYYLAVNVNIVLSREKIIETIWGFDYEGESRTLDVHIKTLRQKLKSGADIIKTVRNVGYKCGV